METTKLSSKGQVVLPKSVREAGNFRPGMEFSVEACADGVLLRPLASGKWTTRLEDVVGCVDYRGPALSLDEMDAAVAAGFEQQHDRG